MPETSEALVKKVLTDSSLYPLELKSWVEKIVSGNPLVKMSSFQVPTTTSLSTAVGAQVGDTSVSIVDVMDAPYIGDWIAIDTGNPYCELRRVTAINGNVYTFAFQSPLAYAHDEGVRIVVLKGASAPVTLWGVTFSGLNEHWNLQRALNETNGKVVLDGLNVAWVAIAQPLLLNGSQTQYLNIEDLPSSWIPPVASDGSSFMTYTMNGQIIPFTASHTNSKITASGHGLTSGAAFILQGLGSSLPGGIIEGQVYYAGNITSTSFKPYADSALTTPVTITADGGGTLYAHIGALNKLSCRRMRITTTTKAGLSGMFANLQQQSNLSELRVDSGLSTADNRVSLLLWGQQSEFYDLEIVNGSTGLQLGGQVGAFIPTPGANTSCEFMDFFGTDIETMGVTAVSLNLAISCGFYGDHFEDANSPSTVHIPSGATATGISFDRFHGAENASDVGLLIDATSEDKVQYTIRNWNATGSSPSGVLIKDNGRGWQINVADLLDAASGNYKLSDFVQPQGLYAPTLGWYPVSPKVTSDYTAKITDQAIFVDSTTGPVTVKLMSPVNILGKKYTVKRIAGTNTVTLATAAGTFDGSATVVVTNAVTYQAVPFNTFWTQV